LVQEEQLDGGFCIARTCSYRLPQCGSGMLGEDVRQHAHQAILLLLLGYNHCSIIGMLLLLLLMVVVVVVVVLVSHMVRSSVGSGMNERAQERCGVRFCAGETQK